MPLSIRIVVVEDELLVRSMVRLFLEHQSGCDVVGEADNVTDACELIEVERPDIVLLDLMLQDECVLNRLPQLLAAGENRVLILTGTEDAALRATALELGAAAVLYKGDPLEKIMGAIQTQAAELFEARSTTSKSDQQNDAKGLE